jgi:hypothetical protein
VSPFRARRAMIWPLAALTAVLAVPACGGISGNPAPRPPAASAHTSSSALPANLLS